MTTRVEVTLVGGRHRTRLRTGLLRPQVVHAPDDRVRIGLIGTTALLLGGDEVDLEVVVGPGARLDLFDVAGTVAYDGRGRAASWNVRLSVAEGGRLRWSGEPLVVADGAYVTRTTALDVAEGGRALVRETVVLGRHGQRGGRLRLRTDARRAGRPVLVEDTLLDPDGLRDHPGLLGGLRLLDSVLALGVDGAPTHPDLPRYRLTDPAGALHRHLGTDLARSPLTGAWPTWWADLA